MNRKKIVDNFYDNVCDVHILTEGYKGGYMVRVEYAEEDRTEVYHVEKHRLIHVLRMLHDTVTLEGDSKDWDKVWPNAA